MRIRLLRALLTLTTLAVVWFVASPALAAGSLLTSVAMTRAPAPMTSAPMSMLSVVDESVPATYRAPLCDPRGATTFAPAPQMQDVEVTLDTGLTLDDCAPSSSRVGRRAAPGRAPAPLDANPSSDAAVITAVATLAAAARELLPVPVASTLCPRPGVRSTVDRPPRA